MHKEILKEIIKNKGKASQHSGNDSYISSGHHYYKVSVPVRRQIAKIWLSKNKNVSQKNFVKLVDALYRGKSHEEKSMASLLLGYHKKGRGGVGPRELDKWFDHLVGWAEIDSLCQNVFTAEEMLKSWKSWLSFIRKLARDKNINKRRASLVFLTGPVTYSGEKRFAKLSFEIIDKLKHEKPIIITKAISWLLRSMVWRYKKDVGDYIKKNIETLPKIAIRETLRKIKTGRK